MLEDLWTAFALLLVLEGLLPALAPQRWQEAMQHLSRIEARHIRLFGIASLVLGAILLRFGTQQ